MIGLLRRLLDLRETLSSIAELARGYGYTDALPEIAQMQKLEQQLFMKIAEWDEADK